MIKPSNGHKNILLVDDDKSVVQMLSILLETRGYRVEIAENGAQALEKASLSTDLILLDLILPDQGGFELCRKLKEDKKTLEIPVIILSGKLLSEDIVQGLYIGADDYVTKPFDYEELVARMEAVMRRGSIFKDGNILKNSRYDIINELQSIIKNEQIVPFFQPIFQLKPFKLYGFEVLCRPRTKSILANPEILFKAAQEFGVYHQLEMLTWKKALNYAVEHNIKEKIFLNCNPMLVESEKFQSVKKIFDEAGVDVANIILEITERSKIADFKVFFKQLSQYREYGVRFAVDDVGGGYSSLESIVETRPEVVKIDRHIIREINCDEFKQSLVRFVVKFCKENKILCVAEGIETKEEYSLVRELGVDAAQGYFLYMPVPHIDYEEVNNLKVAA